MKTQRLLLVGLLSFLLKVGLFAVPRVYAPSTAGAPAFVVDTHEDELNDDDDCSLRKAIIVVNDNASVDAGR